TVGEPINPEAWLWFYRRIGGERCFIVDTWWQTETGSFMISGAPGIEPMPMKPGAAGFALPGIDAAVLTEAGEEAAAGERGLLVIRKPWPGMLLTIQGDPERYERQYWSRFPGVFHTGDYAIRDEEGYYHILGRADEVLKVAGHRLGSLELENAAVSHPAVVEAAAVAIPDPVKGEDIIVYSVLADGADASPELAEEIRAHIREVIGPVATPRAVYLVNTLPKTRSGKIMRRVLRAVASGEAPGDITTLEDEASVDEIRKAYEQLRQTASDPE
ncbi:MAG: AMP-binding protein, partial [Dehalococcoidia bacterium]